jgi:hypothetical protein
MYEHHQSESSGMFMPSSARDYTAITIIACIFGVFIVLGMLNFVLDRSKQSSLDIQNSQALPSPMQISNSRPPTAKNAQTESKPFQTREQREIFATFFIKPVLRELLNDPDSLQDVEIVSIKPDKKMPDTYQMTISYRAKNAFGALVGQRMGFVVTKGQKDEPAWIVVPFKA